jgi:hypothetical protein
MKEYEMSRACSAYRREAEYIQVFGGKDRKTSLRKPIRTWRIILKCILKKCNGINFIIWLRI